MSKQLIRQGPVVYALEWIGLGHRALFLLLPQGSHCECLLEGSLGRKIADKHAEPAPRQFRRANQTDAKVVVPLEVGLDLLPELD